MYFTNKTVYCDPLDGNIYKKKIRTRKDFGISTPRTCSDRSKIYRIYEYDEKRLPAFLFLRHPKSISNEHQGIKIIEKKK